MEQVTIAAIEGFCIGGGVALAVALDFRIMASNAYIRVPEIGLGMNMSWQSVPRMLHLIGPARTKHTLRMIPATGIASKLPRSSTAVNIERPKIIVSLLGDGEIVVEDQKMTPDQLTSYLLGQDPAHANVTIAGAKEASLQYLVIVMDACRSAGVTEIGIAAKNID